MEAARLPPWPTMNDSSARAPTQGCRAMATAVAVAPRRLQRRHLPHATPMAPACHTH